MNPGIDAVCHNLEVGSTLCLGTEGEDCTTTHVVESGDSCQGLQSTYGINSTILYSNNPQLDADCNNLYTGEVCRALALPSSLQADVRFHFRSSVSPTLSSLLLLPLLPRRLASFHQ